MRPDSVSVSLTQKNETRLGIGIVHFKKTRPDSVSVSFNLKNETRLGIGIVQLQKARPVSVSVPFKKMVSEYSGVWEMVCDGILVRLKWETILRSSKSIQDCVKSQNLDFSNVFRGFRGLEDLGTFITKKQGVKFTRHVHTYYDILRRCYTHIGQNFLYFHWKHLISRNNTKVFDQCRESWGILICKIKLNPKISIPNNDI